MRVIDSHTEGEPTRVVISGGPDLGRGPLADRLQRFASTFDAHRSFCVNEPRGNDAVVGALLCEPVNPANAAGVIFFNNVGYLGMCGHGTIGLAVTLAHLGRLTVGRHRFETPVGEVTVHLLDANTVEIENVPAFRHRKDVRVQVPGLGEVVGDIAWGGNWFFLCKQVPLPPEITLELRHVGALTRAAQAVADALEAQGIRGADLGQGPGRVDHIEFFGPGVANDAHSRNFVLCPGGAYDRSPCGTGTSAKLACLAADGALAPGQPWVQESIVGSRFVAQYQWADGGVTAQAEGATPAASPSAGPAERRVLPRIRGQAFVVADATLIRHPADPFGHGLRP